MKNKSYRLLAIILILTAVALVVTGCGKSGNRFANELPSISITSFEGWSNDNIPANVDTTSHEYLFQQKIFWHATDPDGVITGYAFRILDENQDPIAVPGYKYIADAASGLIPENLLNKHGEGWVIHYLPGAPQDYPLDNHLAKRTIWTNQKYALINFPASDENGDPMPTISYFEVLAIDNRGDITKNTAKRKFRTNSNRPDCIASTTRGNPDGGDVGSGMTLRFSMNYPDSLNMLIDAVPSRFEFKMMKIDDVTKQIVAGTETEWFSTVGQERINEFRLTKRTNPPLTYDYDQEGNSLGYSTRVVARAVDLAGVYSDMTIPTDNKPPNWQVNFKVKPGFHPRTTLYSQRILALGENHFEDIKDESTPEDLPYTVVQGENLYATPLFKDFTNTYSVVHSTDLRIYVRWGWWGEYGEESSSGSITYPADNPYVKKFDAVLSEPDSTTGNPGGKNYYSEITHFDLRYDGEPYFFQPFPGSQYNFVDDDGTEWLRLPLYSPLRQSIVLTGNQINPGRHKFEVRAVDSQDEVSKYPAVFEFNVVPYIPPASRSGILIVDDDVDSAQYSPEEIVNAKYTSMTSGIGAVTMFKLFQKSLDPGPEETAEERRRKDARGRELSFSELQKYKLVIYHADHPARGGTIEDEVDGLSLFLRGGGNLVISHTAQFKSKVESIANKYALGLNSRKYTIMDFMGLPRVPKMTPGSQNLSVGAFFQKGVGSSGFPNVGVQYSDNPDNTAGTAAFNPIVESRKGFSAVAYYNVVNGAPNILGDPIYTYGCKPVDFPTSPPTQAQFDTFNGKVVGVRKTNSNGGKVYTFTFPLSYMLDSHTKALINKIWSELQ